MPPLARPDRDRTVELPPGTATVGGATEVLVVGGGPARLGAAVGAARAGAPACCPGLDIHQTP